MAAGALMILEAGGLGADFEGGENFLESGTIVAGTPKVFAPLLAVVQKSGNAAALSSELEA
jgi:myo-inositol-1(or 4)-monophosphatase